LSARRPPRRRGLATALALLAALGFVALGSWQVERRTGKLALIARVEQRVQAPAIDAPGPAQWPAVNAADDAYRRVRLQGRFVAGADTWVQAVTDLGAGFWLITPLQRPDGSIVLVNRGFVAEAPRPVPALPSSSVPRHADAKAPAIDVTGLLRISEPGGGFLRRNDAAAQRWYSRDVQAIAAAQRLERVAPYFVDADADAGIDASSDNGATARPTRPVGGLTVIAFANNHLVYAITWYTLALMSGWAAWRVNRGPAAAPDARGDDAVTPD
jgi:surfeit locus 1 family protein